MRKKKWQNPQLIVLVRGKPEEAVLTACKTTMLSDTPANGNAGCDADPGAPPCQPPCSVWAPS